MAILAFVFAAAFSLVYLFGFRETPELSPVSPSQNDEAVGQIPPEVVPQETIDLSKKVLIENVIFTSQAPFGEWKDPRQQDACEEASAIIAVYWARGQTFDKNMAKKEILSAAKYQEVLYGEYRDTSAKDTLERIIKGYLKYDNAYVLEDVSVEDIITQLHKGNLIIVPLNGRELKNPHFTQPGPERHMLVINGYDPLEKVFATQDPGVMNGEGYKYPKEVLYKAIRDYSSGYHVSILTVEKRAIVVSPQK